MKIVINGQLCKANKSAEFYFSFSGNTWFFKPPGFLKPTANNSFVQLSSDSAPTKKKCLQKHVFLLNWNNNNLKRSFSASEHCWGGELMIRGGRKGRIGTELCLLNNLNTAWEKKNGLDPSDYNLCNGFCRLRDTKLIFSDVNL